MTEKETPQLGKLTIADRQSVRLQAIGLTVIATVVTAAALYVLINMLF